ncbi:MAG: hypothetical protein H5T86_12345, partial [Armatimonadetes bacterium]|nr:hypothetical protein [Armatimonadota bacterium]
MARARVGMRQILSGWRALFSRFARSREGREPFSLARLRPTDFSVRVLDPETQGWKRELRRAYDVVLCSDFEQENLEDRSDMEAWIRRYPPWSNGPRQFYFVVAYAGTEPVGVVSFWFFSPAKTRAGYVCVDYLALGKEWRPRGCRLPEPFSRAERVLIARGLLLEFLARFLQRRKDQWTWLVFECEKVDWRNTGAGLSELSLRVERVRNFVNLAQKAGGDDRGVRDATLPHLFASGVRELAVPYLEPPLSGRELRPPRPMHLLLARNRSAGVCDRLRSREADELLRHVYRVWYGHEPLEGEPQLSRDDQWYLEMVTVVYEEVRSSFAGWEWVPLVPCEPLAAPVMKTFGKRQRAEQDRHLLDIREACEDKELVFRLRPRRVDEYPGFGHVELDVRGKYLMDSSTLIFFDLYRATPNVWTEVGYAAALRHKPYQVVLVPTR